MMGHKEPLKSGDEYTALTRGGRRVHNFKAGVRKWVKKTFNKRVRLKNNRDNDVES